MNLSTLLSAANGFVLGFGQMLTTQDIRRANLKLLLDEIRREIGTDRGAAAHLSRLSGVRASVISQNQSQARHQGGKVRQLGDSQARKLEAGMDKPIGWMDVMHDANGISERDASTLRALQHLTAEQRQLIELQVAMFVKLNNPTGEPEPPGPSPDPRAH